MRRSGLRDDQWQRIKDPLPGARRPGRVTAADHQLFLEAVPYRYRTGMRRPRDDGNTMIGRLRIIRWAH